MHLGRFNDPATSQPKKHIEMSHFGWKPCSPYVDEVIVFSAYMATHVGHVQKLLHILDLADVSLKEGRCTLLENKVDYVSYSFMPGRLSAAVDVRSVVGSTPFRGITHS